MRKIKRGVKLLLLVVLMLTAVLALSCAKVSISADSSEDLLVHAAEGDAEACLEFKQEQVDGLALSAKKNGIRLEWQELASAKVYEIYRKEAGTDGYEKIKTTKKLAYVDKTAAYGLTYVYKVRGITAFGEKLYKSKCSKAKKCVTYHIDPEKPMLALTFDDGPSKYTEQILDVLEKYESRATFFEVGNRVASYPETVKRIVALGSEIGSHSYSHPSLGSASKSKIKSQLNQTDRALKEIIGKKTTLLRPPYGSVGENLRKYADKPFILWSVDTQDWKSRNAQKVASHVMSHASDGDIILMHDLYDSTAEAVTRIVPKLIKKGYQLVTVSELAQYRGIALENGKSYVKITAQ